MQAVAYLLVARLHPLLVSPPLALILMLLMMLLVYRLLVSRAHSSVRAYAHGHKAAPRYIDLTAIAEHLGSDVCTALPALHAFSGCDSTSAFSGWEKKIGL